jgi:2-iminobutanoate/2-iminopropanoate deaminase
MKNLVSVLLLLITLAGVCQTNPPVVSFKNPASVAPPNGYSHVAVIDIGNAHMLILSGQVPLDAKANLVGKGNFAQQTEQVFYEHSKYYY